MTGHDGQKYLCTMPNAGADSDAQGGEGDDETNADGSSSTSTLKASKTAKQVSELLEPLGNSCFYRVEGWWTYEFCHKKKVRQFHQEGEEIVNEYNLGEFSAKETKNLHDTIGADFTVRRGMHRGRGLGGSGWVMRVCAKYNIHFVSTIVVEIGEVFSTRISL